MRKGKIIIFSGAGISAPSGISTFRDSNGLWENHNVQEVCNINTFPKNFDLVHSFYNNLRNSLENKKPNDAHIMIKNLQKKYGLSRVINITQNIDDLFEKAGVEDTLHLHGTLKKMECRNCGNVWDIAYESFNKKDVCKKCNKRESVKPKVVFFGESPKEYQDAKNILTNVTNDDILLVIGTSGSVFPIQMYIDYIINNNIYTDNLTGEKVHPLLILNNMEKSRNISEYYFNNYGHIIYKSCDDSVLEIEKIINENLE